MPTSPLISARELSDILAQRPGTGPLLLDVRWAMDRQGGFEDYRLGHLPGAIFVDLVADLAAEPREDGRGGRRPMPAPDDFEFDLATCGVDNGREIVVYDDESGRVAGRCWWLLRHYGKFDVRVLDGGLASWKAAGLPLEAGERSIEEGDFALGRGLGPILDAAGAQLYAEQGILLDVRSPGRYSGECDPMDRVAGHIPGAVNLPSRTLLAPDGCMLAAGPLREVFAAAGVDGSRPVGVYCGSGVQAGLVALALVHAGLDIEAAYYVGSWSDWISDPGRPVAIGPQPHGDLQYAT